MASIGLVAKPLDEIRKLSGPALIAQQICQHGAAHALEHLLRSGVTEHNVRSMLRNINEAMQVIEERACETGDHLPITHEHRPR